MPSPRDFVDYLVSVCDTAVAGVRARVRGGAAGAVDPLDEGLVVHIATMPAGGSGLTDAELRATPVPVSGTVVTGGLTDVQLRASAVPVSGPLTDVQLRATPVPVSGSVTATGPLTDAQLRASAVPISGALTDAQLRATPVPVSGTVTASGPLTDAQLRATPVPVSGTVTASNTAGDVANDGVDSGNPVKIGGIARTALAAVSNALDRVTAMFDMYGRQIIAKKDQWTALHTPVVATQATIGKASAGAGIKNVCTSIAITLSSIAAPTAGRTVFNLRDGATGAGTILWSGALSLQAVAGVCASMSLTDLWIEGTAATVMTLESLAAPAANIFATVSMTGTITQ